MPETIDAGASAAKPPTTMAHILYLMHALAPFTLWSLALVAVILGLLTRDNVRGTWVESHYQFLLSTFLRGLLWLVGFTIVLVLSIVGILFLWIFWFVLTVWYLWRVIRGWIRLNDGQPSPA